ncbi:glycosyltransferase [Empedobacter tilapiae]|uniref:glycosyltransferase n=1 Tax=Empedobacter tilapiae TaxID=2491114 RepID=UPI0028D11B6C|nr:glycosyltransferase [Empedobacter tilapiae]
MITDKILIFFPNKPNINAGGPSGFIAQNLLDKDKSFYVFPFQLFSEKRLSTFLKMYLNKKSNKNINFSSFIFKEIKAYNYKYIFFHDCETFEYCKHLIRPNQTVILQSHSPELPSIEAQTSHRNSEEVINLLKNAEKNSFERADIIIFPHKDCVPLYESLNFDKSKIRYILSGGKRNEELRKYPLEKDKINLLYIGRRNKIKGFDIVLESFKKVQKKRNDINLIVVGAGEQIESDNIFDVGSTNTPHNWYYNADYVINANRQSYFDLSVIEVLSTGTPLILANNYGHNYYKDKSSGIITFDSNNAVELEDIFLNKIIKNQSKSIENINLYNEELSDFKYYERFKLFFESLK